MKNLVKKSLLIAMFCSAIVAKASGTENGIGFTLIDSKLVDLKLENNDGELNIRVKDTKGQILYSENYTGYNFSKKYDLNTLPSGDYYFEIEGKTKIKLLPFTVTMKEVTLDEIETIYFKPIVRRNNDMVFISKVALNNEDLSIALLNDDSGVLYKETLGGSEFLGKKLNLKNLEKGSYRLVLRSGNYVFSEQITIEK